MYNYKIGYGSYEESSYRELQHEKKFIDEEITEMIAEAVVDTIKKMKMDTRYYTHNFQDVFEGCYKKDCPDVCKYLIEKFGFKPIEYELFWSVFGWPSIFDKTDWEGGRDSQNDHLNKITEAVNKAGFTREDDSHLSMMNDYSKKEE